MEKLRVAVIGVGSLGTHHARIYAQLKDCDLVGVCDINERRAREIARKYRTDWHTDYRDLIGSVDAVSIATPTNIHKEIGCDFLENGVHALVEKPITKTLEEADTLLAAAGKSGALLQVGHVERFNSGIMAVASLTDNPLFIECHRLGPFKKRSLDVGVVLDLMIHDIDIILSLAKSPIIKIDALGGKILTDQEDLANVRLQTESGAVCNITASRVSNKTMRKIRIFQHDAYISLDYEKQEAVMFKKQEKRIARKKVAIRKKEPLVRELSSFIDCIKKGARPVVSGEEAREALRVALEITKQIHG